MWSGGWDGGWRGGWEGDGSPPSGFFVDAALTAVGAASAQLQATTAVSAGLAAAGSSAAQLQARTRVSAAVAGTGLASGQLLARVRLAASLSALGAGSAQLRPSVGTPSVGPTASAWARSWGMSWGSSWGLKPVAPPAGLPAVGGGGGRARDDELERIRQAWDELDALRRGDAQKALPTLPTLPVPAPTAPTPDVDAPGAVAAVEILLPSGKVAAVDAGTRALIAPAEAFTDEDMEAALLALCLLELDD